MWTSINLWDCCNDSQLYFILDFSILFKLLKILFCIYRHCFGTLLYFLFYSNQSFLGCVESLLGWRRIGWGWKVLERLHLEETIHWYRGWQVSDTAIFTKSLSSIICCRSLSFILIPESLKQYFSGKDRSSGMPPVALQVDFLM